ncbi:NUDIX domain-containing protein [Chryseosolibacter indicus]|uniref:NUDIX hydrolase n=1 Tax=Chryseosolibacter indicus TaxID=2782351 RepID=A0ABS5VMW7_9BACT|nr:NUDIX hydrolase [Chryseosolibacter indicus]MBT1702461.1 NUDIX hydrolase [Chryseosolibacter indicus]
MDAEVAKVYGNKVRVRACGICRKGDSILMVNHMGITDTNFWAPPGGGVEFGDSIIETIEKEFCEETGLTVSVESFLFGCEYIQDPIHSIEVFYSVSSQNGKVKKGSDPEIQIIEAVRFMSFNEIKRLPKVEVHGIFHLVETVADLENLKGFYRI